MPQSDKRPGTVFAEMQRGDQYKSGSEFLFDLFQEAMESATGGQGLSGYIPLAEDGKAIDQNANGLAIAAAIAYAGKEIAEAIRSVGPEVAEAIREATPSD